MMVAPAALGIESAAARDRFEEGRLAAAVVADEERHVGSQIEVEPVAEGPDIEWMATGDDLVPNHRNPAQKGAGRPSRSRALHAVRSSPAAPAPGARARARPPAP